MFQSREIDIKLCHNYTKTYICWIYVPITWPELPPIAVQYIGHVIQTETSDNNAALPLVGVLVTCSGRINNVVMTNVFCHDIKPSFNMFENYDSVD